MYKISLFFCCYFIWYDKNKQKPPVWTCDIEGIITFSRISFFISKVQVAYGTIVIKEIKYVKCL